MGADNSKIHKALFIREPCHLPALKFLLKLKLPLPNGTSEIEVFIAVFYFQIRAMENITVDSIVTIFSNPTTAVINAENPLYTYLCFVEALYSGGGYDFSNFFVLTPAGKPVVFMLVVEDKSTFLQ